MNQFNFGEIFKQFGGLKEQMEQARERVGRLRITGEAGAGMVKAEVNGEGRLLNLIIDDELLSVDQKDMLLELTISAVNDAAEKAKAAAAHEMKGMMGGMNIPGLDKLMGNLGL
ncbi:MAG: YbaB/EbfC family nucleoid-associated protein [Leptospiraceae bacterium]|nr:YbaB/EbfC family nucleoid-associated protein [Leptospiraceae bacterium]